MFNSMRSDRFPRLFTYADAKAKEASIKAYSKGKRKGQKPLAERSRYWLTIRSVEMCTGEPNIVIRLHGTDIITYRHGGEIVVNQGGWVSATTHETVARILGTKLYQKHKIGWIECTGGVFPLRDDGANIFHRTDGYYDLKYKNPIYPKVHKLQVTAFNKVRKPFESFIKYASGVVKLMGNCYFSADEACKTFGELKFAHSMEPTDLVALMADQNCWYRAIIVLTNRCKQYPSDPAKEIRKVIVDTLKYVHREHVFEEVEVRDGRMVRDGNASYFKDFI